MKLGPLQQKWVDALRSGEYKQDTGYLRTKYGYCCLGVACEVLGIEGKISGSIYDYAGRYAYLPDEAVDKLKMTSSSGHGGGISLSNLNDCGRSFKEIADYIEKHARFIFKEPA